MSDSDSEPTSQFMAPTPNRVSNLNATVYPNLDHCNDSNGPMTPQYVPSKLLCDQSYDSTHDYLKLTNSNDNENENKNTENDKRIAESLINEEQVNKITKEVRKEMDDFKEEFIKESKLEEKTNFMDGYKLAQDQAALERKEFREERRQADKDHKIDIERIMKGNANDIERIMKGNANDIKTLIMELKKDGNDGFKIPKSKATSSSSSSTLSSNENKRKEGTRFTDNQSYQLKRCLFKHNFGITYENCTKPNSEIIYNLTEKLNKELTIGQIDRWMDNVLKNLKNGKTHLWRNRKDEFEKNQSRKTQKKNERKKNLPEKPLLPLLP